MTILGHHLPTVGEQRVFETLGEVFGYRMVFQEADPCPNGLNVGYEQCNHYGQRKGFHPRGWRTGDYQQTLIVGSTLPEYTQIKHRWRIGPSQLEREDGEESFEEGHDYALEGRKLVWLIGPPIKGVRLALKYRAYEEFSANVQHVYINFAGGGAKSESSLNLPFAVLQQGRLALSVAENTPAYHVKEGDLFLPTDADMRFDDTFTINAAKCRKELGNDGIEQTVWRFRSQHKFVLEMVKAYTLNNLGTEDVPVDCRYDLEKQEFVLRGKLKDASNVVVIYDACPIYFAYLDSGEFRSHAGQRYPRLIVLSRLEITR